MKTKNEWTEKDNKLFLNKDIIIKNKKYGIGRNLNENSLLLVTQTNR